MNKEELKYQINFLHKSIDEIAYLSSLIELKKIGSLYSCRCPFHSEKTPSLRVYPKGHKNSDGKIQEYTSWYCFGCHKGGDIVKFEELYYDLDSIEEACLSLQNKFGLVFNEDSKLNELKIAMKEMERQKNPAMSLLEINFVCSIACRTYLNFVQKEYPNLFLQEFEYIQSIYKKLDYELLERNALEAKELIDITNNSLKRRKNMLTK